MFFKFIFERSSALSEEVKSNYFIFDDDRVKEDIFDIIVIEINYIGCDFLK